MCTLHDYLSSKVRFIQTSTVTGSDSCSGKKLRVGLAYILFYMHSQYVGVCNDLQSRNLVNPKKYKYIFLQL